MDKKVKQEESSAINLSSKPSLNSDNKDKTNQTGSSSCFLIKNILNLSGAASSSDALILNNCNRFAKEKSYLVSNSNQLGYLMNIGDVLNCNDQVIDLSVIKCNNYYNQFGLTAENNINLQQEKHSKKKRTIKLLNEMPIDSTLNHFDSNSLEKKGRNRTMFSEWQLATLEHRFSKNKYLTTGDRSRVAKLLKLNQLQVKTWFQVSKE